MQFLASPVATTVIQCSLAACVTHHRDAFNSVMKFFRDLLRVAREEEVVSGGGGGGDGWDGRSVRV